MSGDEQKPKPPGTGAGGASGPTGASNASSAGAAAFGPQEIARRDVSGSAAGRAREGMFGTQGSGDTSGFGGLRLPGYAPAPAERPYGGWFDEVVDETAAALADDSGAGVDFDACVQQVTVDRGEMTWYVDRAHLVRLARTLRDDPALRFEFCSGVSGVDYGEGVPQQLHVVTHLLSMTYRRRLRLEIALDLDDARCPSLVEVYPTADWHERETWDMFGVVFEGHPSLTRILMPDDWNGHPQLKSYPLGGIPVEYHDAEIPPPDQRRAYT
ncbi:NADH-quinone oxidoreductase subunit C [Actinomycetospora rhizophila]|uniref:NADH-quinone oxidoreductase subunit C n=1 Tax=Actinomycetospora rhizophila TaxID=1416876 RepID=A0ABV9ZNX9_9PSEU